MADEAVTTTQMAVNTATADLVTAATTVTVEVDATNTAVISDCAAGEKLFFVFYENGGGAATATFKAGDNPPAMHAGMGDLEIAVPTNDVIAVAVDTSRFLQDDGKIRILIGGQNVHVTALRLPKGT
jgi:hypothetical protein